VPRVLPTLQRRAHPLASPERQRELLARLPQSFERALAEPLRPTNVEVLQVNVGKRCNQTCGHCHVDAGPDRREVMSDGVVDACLALLEKSPIPTLDITGGAPELHPRFVDLVTRARALGRHVMDRCNLTVLLAAPHARLPELLAEQQVEIVASLPWYTAKQTDAQRGEGVFDDSITALRRLNDLGYGAPGSGRVLNLVMNPVGAFMPARQPALERDFERQLTRRHGIRFNRLFTITNMPIGRFLEMLEAKNLLAEYVERLARAFNPAAVAGLMCRTTLSVGWDGRLYDCDFNQMLDMPLDATIHDVDLERLQQREVRVGPHCFGCTAGSGSSCGGATVAA
jgi:radical SAM/Cys-rich protein